MTYKLNIRGASGWSNLLEDANIQVTDTADDFTGTLLSDVLKEINDGTVKSMVAGTGISIDDTDTQNPIISSVGLEWNNVSTNTASVTGNGYFVDTTSSQITIQLPSTATIGDAVAIADYSGSFGVNKCIIDRNGHKIMGLDEDFYCDYNNLSIKLVYSDITTGWGIIYTADGNSGGGGTSGSLDWSTPALSGDFTARDGMGYFIDTSSSIVTMSLPLSATAGNIIAVSDYKGVFGTNNLTIDRNGHNIVGVAQDFVGSVDGFGIQLVYVDTTQGWMITSSTVDDPNNIVVDTVYVDNGLSLKANIASPTFTGTVTSTGNVVPASTGAYDLGSSSLRWRNIYTNDLQLSNGIGDYTIVEGEDDLFLYNNKSNKTYKFALIEVDPSVVPNKVGD